MTTDRSKRLKKQSRLWTWIAIFSFLIGGLLLFLRLEYNLRDFYSENYCPYALNIDMSPASDPHLEQAISLYTKGDFGGAYQSFSEQQNHENLNDDVLIAMGISKMEAEEYWEAIDFFQKVKERGTSVDVAEWYKVLSLIALERKDEARDMLGYYVSNEEFEFNREQAEKLLKEY